MTHPTNPENPMPDATPTDLTEKATVLLSVLTDDAKHELHRHALTEKGSRRYTASVLRELVARVRELEGWKADAIAVDCEWDAQAVGRLLGVPLGHSIRAAIQPGIEALLARVRELESRLTQGGANAALSAALSQEARQFAGPLPTPAEAERTEAAK